MQNLFKFFKGKIVHTTTLKNFELIKKDGFLHPNTGDYPVNFPQYNQTMGARRSFISVFDLRSYSNEIYRKNSWCDITFDSVFYRIGRNENISMMFDLKKIQDFYLSSRDVMNLLRQEVPDLMNCKNYGDIFKQKGKFCPQLEGFLIQSTPLSMVQEFVLVRDGFVVKQSTSIQGF